MITTRNRLQPVFPSWVRLYPIWECDPARCLTKDRDELFDHYRHALEPPGQQKGTLCLFFGKVQNSFQDPAKLRRLVVDLIAGDLAEAVPAAG